MRVAVRDVSLSVNAGEIVTLLGPNGAGKTTTMRMLAGLILPTSGRISIDGSNCRTTRPPSARGNVGLLTEAPGLWERLSVRTNLLTYARLHGLADPDARSMQHCSRSMLLDRAERDRRQAFEGPQAACRDRARADSQAAGAAAR